MDIKPNFLANHSLSTPKSIAVRNACYILSMELRVSSYGSRADLEKYCEKLKPSEKEGLVIVGSHEELSRFHLSSSTTVHGVPCELDKKESLYTPPPKSTVKRIKAGGYGLNGKLKKLK